jgi:hypothetical protein
MLFLFSPLFVSLPWSLGAVYSPFTAEVTLCPEDTKFQVPLTYVVSEPDHVRLKRQTLDCYTEYVYMQVDP